MMTQLLAGAALGVTISILTIQEDSASNALKVKSTSARRAESDFEKAIAAAEKEYLAKVRQAQTTLVRELEKSRSAATKAGELEDAVALRDRIKQISETTPGVPKRGIAARDRLARDVADSTWVGSPNWGRFALNADGSMAFEKLNDKTSHWGAMSHEAVGVIDGSGNVSVLVFDQERRFIKAHYAGQIGKSSWGATRVKGR